MQIVWLHDINETNLTTLSTIMEYSFCQHVFSQSIFQWLG